MERYIVKVHVKEDEEPLALVVPFSSDGAVEDLIERVTKRVNDLSRLPNDAQLEIHLTSSSGPLLYKDDYLRDVVAEEELHFCVKVGSYYILLFLVPC